MVDDRDTAAAGVLRSGRIGETGRSSVMSSTSAVAPDGALAYGLSISAPGLDTGMRPAAGDRWPSVRVEHDPEPLTGAGRRIDLDGAELELADGTRGLRLSRAGERAVFHGPEVPPDELVHPYLWPVASIFSRWLGREAFHAGAVVLDGGAWALLGPKEAGKSTMLACWAARGGAVLADDLVIIGGAGDAFAGPRCIDLRDAVPGIAATHGLARTRGGERLRMPIAPIAPAVPFRGWLFLSWGETIDLQRIHATLCLARLARSRAWGELPSDGAHLLALAALPAFEFARPREWGAVDASLAALAELSEARDGRGCGLSG